MKKLLCLILLGSVLIETPASAVSINWFTDRALWTSALNGTYFEEQFDSTVLHPGLQFVSTNGGVDTYYDNFSDDVYNLSGMSATTTWSYTGGFTGFGGSWTPNEWGGPGAGLLFTAFYNGGSMVIPGPANTIPGTYNNQFFGIVSDTPLTSVLIEAGIPSGGAPRVEGYYVDNLVIGSGEPAPVPEPSTILLLGAGIAGIAFARRKRK